MKKCHYVKELLIQIRLTTPIILAQISMMAMEFVDMVMAGSVSSIDMASVALGSSIWMLLILFGYGILQALHPIISQLRGAGKTLESGHILRQGLWLALGLSAPLIFIVYLIAFLLEIMGIEPPLASLTRQYLCVIAWGAPGFLFFAVIRCYFEGMAFMRPGMAIGCFGLFANIFLNYIFIFGHFGSPAYGGVGAGIATAIVYWIMFGVILYYAFRLKYSRQFLQWKNWKEGIKLSTINQLVRIGFPGAFAVFFEETTFVVIVVFIASFGVTIVAGHQVALNVSAILFMLPFSLGITATVRTGYSLGSHDYEMVFCVRKVVLSLGLMVSLVTAIVIFYFRYEIATMYSNDPHVLNVATTLMFFVAIYQSVNAIQAISLGILKGYKDTKIVFYITFISYWLVTIPLGYILGRTNWIVSSMGVEGFWLAILIGLSIAAILGLLRVYMLEYRLHKQEVNAYGI